jgi:hypothetical protein
LINWCGLLTSWRIGTADLVAIRPTHRAKLDDRASPLHRCAIMLLTKTSVRRVVISPEPATSIAIFLWRADATIAVQNNRQYRGY